MEERTVAYLLLILGIIVLALQTDLADRNFKEIRESGGPEIFSQVICLQQNGTYLLSKPATSDACSDLVRLYRRVSKDMCMFASGEKTDVCAEIVALAEKRKVDCMEGIFTGKYSYDNGAPEAAELCGQIMGN
ncbi:MAG: hypothetical protein V1835_03505 [Candidatus Micrarchaeota archaeon]